MVFKCERCGKTIYAKHKYCKSCYKKVRTTIKCVLCGKSIVKGKYCSECSIYGIWASKRSHNKKAMGIVCNYSNEWLAQKAKEITHCPICGVELDYCATEGHGIKPNYASIDRINNDTELTEDNVWIICCRCNVTKQDRTMKEFVEYCKLVATRF